MAIPTVTLTCPHPHEEVEGTVVTVPKPSGEQWVSVQVWLCPACTRRHLQGLLDKLSAPQAMLWVERACPTPKPGDDPPTKILRRDKGHRGP